MNTPRKLLSLATAFIVIGSISTQAADSAADEAALKADPAAWFKAFNAGDADAVTKLYAEDGIVMAPNAPASVGRAAIREFIASGIKEFKSAGLSFKDHTVTGVGVFGDTGWLSGTYSVANTAGQIAEKGKFLSVYRRTKEGWRLIRDIWNADAPPPK